MSLQQSIDALNQTAMPDDEKQRIINLLRLVSKSSADMDGFEMRAAREAAGISASQAARLIGGPSGSVTTETVLMWERGEDLSCRLRWSDRINETYGLASEES